MRVLALDTTTREGSVALVEDDRVVVERGGDPARSHAERLPGDLTAALDSAGWSSSDIDVFAVVAGPGSFTGLRIGIATMQGMAFVLGRPIVPVSTLEALAQIASVGRPAGARVAAWVDAHRGEVYASLYDVSGAPPFSPERIVEVDAPTASNPASLLERWRTAHTRADVFVGDGADVYDALLRDEGEHAPTPRLAAAAGLMAVICAVRGQSERPSRVHPIYVRRPDVEVARERARTAP